MKVIMTDTDYIYEQLNAMFPDAGCELNYQSRFQLLCAVILSAQTTDVSVNKVTPELFKRFSDAKSMAQADIKEVEDIIRSIGLYRNKANSLVKMSQALLEQYDGEVPCTIEELVTLPGVGRKTANVVVSEGFGVPAIAVDTHVHRVSKRLGLAEEEATVEETEKALQKLFDESQWSHLHHLLIFFGRYKCLARKPLCDDCPFINSCVYHREVK